jgi:WD40 repeat protein
MRIYRTVGRCLALAALALSISGCFYETLSWSPDGRYLALIEGEDRTLYLWDSQTQKTHRVCDGVLSCRFIPSGHLLFAIEPGHDAPGMFSTSPEGTADTFNLHRGTPTSHGLEPVDTIYAVLGFSVGVSEDGQYLYYQTQLKGEEHPTMWESKLTGDKNATRLTGFPEQIAFPAPDSARNRIAFMDVADEKGVLELWDSASSSSVEIESMESKWYWYPAWVDDSHLICVVAGDGDDDQDMAGDLVEFDVAARTRRTICSGVVGLGGVKLSADRKTAYVTAHKSDRSIEWPSALQAAKVDVSTGEMTFLTDDTFGAALSRYNPATNQLAYVAKSDSADNAGNIVSVLDLKTGEQRQIWVDDETRRFSTAEVLLNAGRTEEALLSYADLLRWTPDSRLSDMVHYRMVECHLKSTPPDLDAAYANLASAGDETLRGQASAMIWQNADATAQDPPDDLVRTYGTDASRKEYQFDTDKPRDLLGVSAKWSGNKLYIKVDYNSAQDIHGLVLADTLVLIGINSPEGGWNPVTPCMQWERSAERIIWLRHWFNSSEKGQYDLEVIGGDGGSRGRVLVSDFSLWGRTDLPVVDTAPNWALDKGSVVLAVSRDSLHVATGDELFIQVCTLKGGLDDQRGLERPRETPDPGQPKCDIADTFGAENTRARIDAEIESLKGKADAKPTIRGYAITVKVPEEVKN